jgi:succinate-semialdehyde dehydrogenase / glutarate-semialdehyde dehydrogenase
MQSINPYTLKVLAQYDEMTTNEAKQVVGLVYNEWLLWKEFPYNSRAVLMHRVAKILRDKKNELARLICLEMGKLIGEALGEVEKCAWVCDYYADHTEKLLSNEPIPTEARKSQVLFQPLGPILAIMPWNYPFWQTFRFAAPALMAGNTALLKHASNVQGCALAIEQLFREAGFPEQAFRTLVISASKVEDIIAHPMVKGVTLTGSEEAGRKVASAAGRHLKKLVLELGGSDPLIILSDANLDQAVQVGLKSRMLTSGQTCISAKRFIMVKEVANRFIDKLKTGMQQYLAGDPLLPQTTLAPLSKRSFAEEVHRQVTESVSMGAQCLLGGRLPEEGCFYPPTLLAGVTDSMPAFCQETFGPVIALTVVDNDDEAIREANNSRFGLGASVWTQDEKKAERFCREIEAGAVFVNQLVKSDPRMPFGGIKNSGYGRELSSYGIKEFCNIKSVWIE